MNAKLTYDNTFFSVNLIATLLITTLVFFSGFHGNAQIAVGSTSTETAENVGVGPITFNHNTANGTNRLLLVGVSVYRGGGNNGVSAVTYGGQSMTLVASLAPNTKETMSVYIFSLVNPPTGNNNVVVTLTGGSGSMRTIIGATSFTGVHPTDTFGNTNTSQGTSNSASLTIVAESSDQRVYSVVAAGKKDFNGTNVTVGSGQTALWGTNGINNTRGNGNASWRNGANGNVSFTYAMSGTPIWMTAGVVLKPACGNSLATHHFRTKATGNWSAASTWESSSNQTFWCDATLAPTSAAASIQILNGHTVTVNANSSANNLTVNGTLTSNANLDLAGDVTIQNGTWNLNEFSANRTTSGGTFTMHENGKIFLTGTNNYPSNFTANIAYPSSEVHYIGNDQTIRALHTFVDNYNGNGNNGSVQSNNTPASYGKLVLGGNGIKTLSGVYVRVLGNVEVKEQARINVAANQAITLGGTFRNETGSVANVVFEDKGSLIQIGNTTTAQNVGSITYKRATNPLKHLDFVYWGSMVENQTLANMWMTNASETFYRFNPAVNNWTGVAGSTVMASGVGYIARARHNANGWAVGANGAPTVYNTQMVGTPRTGNIEVTVTPDRWNLIANPYPTAIHFREFAKQNNSSLAQSPIQANAYIWTQTTPITNNSYTANDYAVYNGSLLTSTQVGGFTAKNHIAAGQAFFVRTKANAQTTITFTDQMKVIRWNDNFTKPGGGKDNEQETLENASRIWLNLTNTIGDFKQIAVVHTNIATNGYDDGVDALAFNGNTNMNFFSLVGTTRISIQGRAALDIADQYDLGFQAGTAGNYTISLADFDGQFTNQAVFLVDMLLNTVHNLKTGGYTFNTASGVHLTRFKIKYYDEVLSNPVAELQNLVAFTNNQTLHIKTGGETLDQVEVFDIQGRTLQTFKNIQQMQVAFPLPIATQVILVKCTSTDGKTTTKKLMI